MVLIFDHLLKESECGHPNEKRFVFNVTGGSRLIAGDYVDDTKLHYACHVCGKECPAPETD